LLITSVLPLTAVTEVGYAMGTGFILTNILQGYRFSCG
jgi:hypothetical protein